MEHYKTVSELHRNNGWEPPEDPLFGMVHYRQNHGLGEGEFSCDCYMIGFTKQAQGAVLCGGTRYDHTNGSMMFGKPRQVVAMKNIELEKNGFILFIHEDYLQGNELCKTINKYDFFESRINEALCLSPAEEEIIYSLHRKIEREYYNTTDEYSRGIIISHIKALLTYTNRFFKQHLKLQ